MATIVVRDNGQDVGMFTTTAKTFSTGSKGYHAFGKLALDGKAYQANIMLVEIGSKPKTPAKVKAPATK